MHLRIILFADVDELKAVMVGITGLLGEATILKMVDEETDKFLGNLNAQESAVLKTSGEFINLLRKKIVVLMAEDSEHFKAEVISLKNQMKRKRPKRKEAEALGEPG